MHAKEKISNMYSMRDTGEDAFGINIRVQF